VTPKETEQFLETAAKTIYKQQCALRRTPQFALLPVNIQVEAMENLLTVHLCDVASTMLKEVRQILREESHANQS